MMKRSRQPYFPMHKGEDTRRDILYNDVITLMRNKQKNGWSGVNTESFANKFMERLIALLCWYIDPHREKLIARSLKLSDILFNELEQYQPNEIILPDIISHEKLEQPIKSLEVSIEQPKINGWILLLKFFYRLKILKSISLICERLIKNEYNT